MEKLKRNDPCYCGSGKKYKQCHLKIDQAAEQEKRALTEATRFLRRDLLKFSRDEQFAGDFAQALPRYWNGLYTIENAEEMSQEEALRFFDWFMFDYQLENGRYLINHYVESRYEDLSSVQQAVLDQWKDADPSAAYELVGYDGQTLHLKNFLTGETVDAWEATGRGIVQVGEVILTRLVPVQERYEFSTTAAYLPHDEIGDLRQKLEAARQADLEQYPDATAVEFLRRHNHLIVHHALAEAERVGRPPVARLDPDRPDKKTQKIVRQMKRMKR